MQWYQMSWQHIILGPDSDIKHNTSCTFKCYFRHAVIWPSARDKAPVDLTMTTVTSLTVITRSYGTTSWLGASHWCVNRMGAPSTQDVCIKQQGRKISREYNRISGNVILLQHWWTTMIEVLQTFLQAHYSPTMDISHTTFCKQWKWYRAFTQNAGVIQWSDRHLLKNVRHQLVLACHSIFQPLKTTDIILLD